MEPIYKGFQDINNFIENYGNNSNSNLEEIAAEDALFHAHNHTCWLNPTGGYYNRRTKHLCKKFWKHKKKPALREFEDLCDRCPNCILYYKDNDNFLLALGNSYAYEAQGLMEKL